MDFRLILGISKTHLLARKKQSAIAALGVTFGIGTFIIMVSFMTGLNGLLDGLIIDRTPHIRLYNKISQNPDQPAVLSDDADSTIQIIHSLKPKKTQTRIHNSLAILGFLKSNPKVLGATPQMKAQVFYTAGGTELNGIINGVNVMEEDRLYNVGNYFKEGKPQDLAKNENGIILGAGVAKKLMVNVGDRVQITTPAGGIFPLKVVGFYQSGLAEIDDVQSYANIKTAQKIMGGGDNLITDINIKLHDMELSPELAQIYSKLFGVFAIDIKAANAQFETGTKVRNIITFSVSIALLIVAGFGIYNILNMLIYEKMNDIAILKATGFSGGDVKMIFLSQALIIGLVGGLLGLIIGFGASVAISHTPFETEALPTIKTYPVNFDPNFYLIGSAFAILTTLISGYMPAKRAENIDPVEIIRGQ